MSRPWSRHHLSSLCRAADVHCHRRGDRAALDTRVRGVVLERSGGALSAPTWKQDCKFCDLFHVFPGGAPGDYPPFWTTSTTNNLYGVQLGVEATIWEFGRFASDGAIKAGLYDNVASQLTGISLQKVVYPASATANRLAFAGEASVRLKYQVGERVTLKVSYEALWLAGVALAPAQVDETYTGSTVSALGVDTGSNVLFQGVTFGVEYVF